MGSPFQGTDAADSLDKGSFLAASRELLSLPSDPAVARFLRTFPLSTLVAVLKASPDPEIQGAALGCLRCAVKSDSAAGELLGFLPSMEEGLFSPSPEIQELSCLAAQRIGQTASGSVTSTSTSAKAVPGGDAATELLLNKIIARGLLQCEESPSTTVATSAADAIVAVCSTSFSALDSFFSEPTLRHASEMLTKSSTQTQQRVIALFARLSAVNPDRAVPIISKLGVMELLLDMIGGKGYCQRAAERQTGGVPNLVIDELAALTACELLTDFVRHTGSARVISETPFVTGALLHLLSQTASPPQAASSTGLSPGTVGLVVRAAWKSAAHLVAPPSPDGPSPLSPDDALHLALCLGSLCRHLSPSDQTVADASDNDKVMTDMAERELDDVDTKDWEEAVCEAAAIMSCRVQGAKVLLLPTTATVTVHVVRRAFACIRHQHASPDLQVSALHALASLLGSDRAVTPGRESRTSSHTLRNAPEVGSPLVVFPPEHVELDSNAEEALREALYYSAASASGGPTLGGVLVALLKHEERVRIAVYRIVAVLVERPWGLAEVCGSAVLVDALGDPLSEKNKEAMDWRHTAVVAAASAASLRVTAGASGELFSTVVSTETLNKLDGAAKMGPYAVRRMVQAIPEVAVLERM